MAKVNGKIPTVTVTVHCFGVECFTVLECNAVAQLELTNKEKNTCLHAI